MQFALVNDRLLVAMHELDGIFDGKNVIGVGLIDAIENGRQCGRLARARRSGDQHDSVVEFGNLSKLRRKIQVGEAGNCLGNDAHHYGVAAALLKYVDTEAAEPRVSKASVACLLPPISS